MNQLTDYQRQLEAVSRRLHQVTNELDKLLVEQGELQRLKYAWETIINQERKQSGEDVTHEVLIVQPVSRPPVQTEEEGEGLNKTQFVMDKIKERAAIGTTPEDLKTAARVIGMKHAPSWPYGPLQRLKKRDLITKRRGKFYPKEATEQSNLALVG
jgi:hypothetical protein